MLVQLLFAPFLMALGVIYDDPRPSFEDAIMVQDAQQSAGKVAKLAKLLAKGQTWTVAAENHWPMSNV